MWIYGAAISITMSSEASDTLRLAAHIQPFCFVSTGQGVRTNGLYYFLNDV